MYTVYVRLARDVPAEQRQAEVTKQLERGSKDLNQRQLMEGESLEHWPKWMAGILNRYGFLYDHYNWLYLKHCATEADSIRCQTWVIMLSNFLMQDRFLNKIKMLCRMRSPGLWPWLFGRCSHKQAEIASRLEPTILQEIGTIDGPGNGPSPGDDVI